VEGQRVAAEIRVAAKREMIVRAREEIARERDKAR
jgi:hypothetical protein